MTFGSQPISQNRLCEIIALCTNGLKSNSFPNNRFSELVVIFVNRVMAYLKGPAMVYAEIHYEDSNNISKGKSSIKDDTLQQLASILLPPGLMFANGRNGLSNGTRITSNHRTQPISAGVQVASMVSNLPTRIAILWTKQAVIFVYNLWHDFSLDRRFRTNFATLFGEHLPNRLMVQLIEKAYLKRHLGVSSPLAEILERYEGIGHITHMSLTKQEYVDEPFVNKPVTLFRLPFRL